MPFKFRFPASGKEIASSSPRGQFCHRFTLGEIKVATDNFNENSVIGRGGFGKVYKGLIDNETYVAVKRLDPNSHHGASEFLAEVEILPMLRHRNIVELIGCYDDDTEMILVYEYLSNGDLASLLHQNLTPLSWSQRLKIGIDIARALDYLHSGTKGKGIIHVDPKSANILLDDQWTAKITDFGLSRVIPVDSPSTHVSTTIMRTIGYMDPEFYHTGRLSKKCDVYIFGVVLLEMLCRRRAMDMTGDEEHRSLTVWALDCMKKGKLKSIIDPDLRGEASLKGLNDYAKIAQGCLHQSSGQRISMAEAVVGLESILALHEKAAYSTPQMGKRVSNRSLRKYFLSSGGRNYKKVVKFLSAKSKQLKGDHGHMSKDDTVVKFLSAKSKHTFCEGDHCHMSEDDIISEASYQLRDSLRHKHKTMLSYDESDLGSESNHEVIDEDLLPFDEVEGLATESSNDYLQQYLDLMRWKDLLHLIWFYPLKKEMEVNFGSLVDKFSTLSKYINKSDGGYVMEIQTLLHDIDEDLEDAILDMGVYLPQDMELNKFWAVDFEKLVTGDNSRQLPLASFWLDKPEIHASIHASIRERAVRCIKDLKVKKLWISGSAAEEVAAALTDLPELKDAFDMVLFVHVKHHSIKELMNEIKEKMHLWKKRDSETRNVIHVSDNFRNCLLFVDFSEDFIDLQEIKFHLSKWFQIVQIVMTSGPHTSYFPVDLEIKVQDHLLPWILFSKNADLAAEGYSSIKQMATQLVERCHGHLLAITLLARALRGVHDISLWELALQELASQQDPLSSQSGIASGVMLSVLRFVWSRMKAISQKCIIQFALRYAGEEFGKSSLLHSWVTDGLVKSEQEGEYVFEDHMRSFLLEQFGENCVKMRDETRVTLAGYFVSRLHGLYLKQDGSESNRIPSIEEWDAREIHLTNNILSELPDDPKCPILVNLFLHSNQDLMDIPNTFFDNMPSLHVLDLSSTSIKYLPSTISKLTALRKLFLRNCDLMMELPPEIGGLKNLKVFDSEGTQLISLPEQLGSLTKLECLKFSLYNVADWYKQSNQSRQIIPAADLSKLLRLKELSICINTHGEWWESEVTPIIEILSKLRNLESLRIYIPTMELLRIFMETQNWEGIPIYKHLRNFGFIVGRLQQRLLSRLASDLEKMFVKLPKCLKYTDGEGETEVIAKLLKHANALFLDHHWTIKSLSIFGLAEMEKLKFCLLAECNEMLQVVDGSHLADSSRPVLQSLEYLSIHYMKSLSCIWNGPIHSGCLSNLKTLLIHTCPELSTLFTPGLLDNLSWLEYLVIDDCEQLNSLVNLGSDHYKSTTFLPNLKKMTLLHLPELVSICSDTSIAPRLESLVVYDCPELKKLPYMKFCDDLREIKGENEWWDALEWCEPEWSSGQPDYLASVFVPLGIDDDITDELANAVNFLPDLSD